MKSWHSLFVAVACGVVGGAGARMLQDPVEQKVPAMLETRELRIVDEAGQTCMILLGAKDSSSITMKHGGQTLATLAVGAMGARLDLVGSGGYAITMLARDRYLRIDAANASGKPMLQMTAGWDNVGADNAQITVGGESQHIRLATDGLGAMATMFGGGIQRVDVGLRANTSVLRWDSDNLHCSVKGIGDARSAALSMTKSGTSLDVKDGEKTWHWPK